MSAVSGLNGQPINGYEGFLQGKVIANNDPLKLQRIKVAVPKLFNEEANIDTLPWIGPCKHSPFGIGDNFGVVSVPLVGSRVCIILQDGKTEYGLLVHDQVNPSFVLPDELATDYPNRVGMITPTGDVMYYDVITGVWFFRHNKGTSLRVDASGNVFKVVEGDYSELVKGNYTRIVEGNYSESIKGTYTVARGASTYSVSGAMKLTVSSGWTEVVSGAKNTTTASWTNAGVFKNADDIISGNTSLTGHQHPYTDNGNPMITDPPNT